MHGGRIEVSSDGPGHGAEFVLHLPIAPDGSADVAEKSGVALQDLGPCLRRILVVDDNRDAADSLGMLLTFLGAAVYVVYDGASALEALPVYQPSVVLLDIGMPGMDGHEVAQRVRRMPGFRDVLLIAMTGWGQEEDRRRSKAAGFDYHLLKPANADAVQALLASLPLKKPIGE
jgi:CheY-like chemotaxis protein